MILRRCVPLAFAAALAPSMARSEIVVRPGVPSLDLGVHAEAQVAIDAEGVAEENLEVRASAGEIVALRTVSDGHFVARYVAPSGRAPDVAVLLARTRDGRQAAVGTIVLRGRYRQSLLAEARARVEVQLVGGEVVRAVASRRGEATVTLSVAPSQRSMHVVVIDRVGNRVERDEALPLPPLHRALWSLRSVQGSRAEWWLAAADIDGAASSAPPTVVCEGSRRFEVTAVAPGLFSVRAEMQPSLREQWIEPTVSTPEVAPVGNAPTLIAPRVLARAVIEGPREVPAGEEGLFTLRVYDQEERAVGGLERGIVIDGEGRLERADPSGEGGYVLRWRASPIPGSGQVRVGVVGDDPRSGGADASLSLRVVPGAPTRMEPIETALVMGQATRLTVHVVDRFGNVRSLRDPVVRADGATVRTVQSDPVGFVVELVADSMTVRLRVRGEEGLGDSLDVPVSRPPERSFYATFLGVGRYNLGAAAFGGIRARVGYSTGPLSRWAFIVNGELGLEAGGAAGAGGYATIMSMPLFLRVGGRVRLAPWAISLSAGVGGRASLAIGGETDAEPRVSFFPSGSLLGSVTVLRSLPPLGALLGELGYEASFLQTLAARGSLGGPYAGVGWSFSF